MPRRCIRQFEIAKPKSRLRSREVKSAKANSRSRSKHEAAKTEISLRGFESAALASRLQLRNFLRLRGFGFAGCGFDFAASASRLCLRDFGFAALVRPLRLRGFRSRLEQDNEHHQRKARQSCQQKNHSERHKRRKE